MDKKGPWKNGSQRTKHQADLSIPNDAELESTNVYSKGQVSGSKAILALQLTNKSSLRLRATESALLEILHRLLCLYHQEAIEWLEKKGHLSMYHRS